MPIDPTLSTSERYREQLRRQKSRQIPGASRFGDIEETEGPGPPKRKAGSASAPAGAHAPFAPGYNNIGSAGRSPLLGASNAAANTQKPLEEGALGGVTWAGDAMAKGSNGQLQRFAGIPREFGFGGNTAGGGQGQNFAIGNRSLPGGVSKAATADDYYAARDEAPSGRGLGWLESHRHMEGLDALNKEAKGGSTVPVPPPTVKQIVSGEDYGAAPAAVGAGAQPPAPRSLNSWEKGSMDQPWTRNISRPSTPAEAAMLPQGPQLVTEGDFGRRTARDRFGNIVGNSAPTGLNEKTPIFGPATRQSNVDMSESELGPGPARIDYQRDLTPITPSASHQEEIDDRSRLSRIGHAVADPVSSTVKGTAKWAGGANKVAEKFWTGSPKEYSESRGDLMGEQGKGPLTEDEYSAAREKSQGIKLDRELEKAQKSGAEYYRSQKAKREAYLNEPPEERSKRLQSDVDKIIKKMKSNA